MLVTCISEKIILSVNSIGRALLFRNEIANSISQITWVCSVKLINFLVLVERCKCSPSMYELVLREGACSNVFSSNFTVGIHQIFSGRKYGIH